jgi:membrane-bound ClpP family serine protease
MINGIVSAMALTQLSPDFAFVLIITGLLGICAEFLRPGAIAPGVLGAMAALYGIAALLEHPMDWRGAALLLLAPPLFGAEALFATRGLLGLAGGVCMLAGALILKIHLATALATTIPFSVILTVLFSIAIRARRNKSTTNTRAAIS